MTSTPVLATSSIHCCCGWKAWLILWMLFAVAEAALLANNAALDTLAWRTTRWFMGDQDAYRWDATKAAHAADADAPFYYRVDPPLLHGRLYKRTESLWRVCRDFGEPFMTVVLMAAVLVYDQRRRWRASLILFSAAASAGLLGGLIRMISGRYRPNAELPGVAGMYNEGGNYWQLFRGFHEGSDLSFPSGHATLAFVCAAALSYLSPKGRGLFITIAVGTALARVVMQAHFFSDALLGAVLGWTVGWCVTVALDRRLVPPIPGSDGNARP